MFDNGNNLFATTTTTCTQNMIKCKKLTNLQQKHSVAIVIKSYFSMLLLLVMCILPATCVNAATADTLTGSSAAPPLPYASALASPGASSTILEQFSPNCSAVSHIFKIRGIDAAEIPQKPSKEMGLRYCESTSVGTCCTYNMETRMALQSRQQLEKYSKDQITKMSGMLATKAQKFNELFRSLLQESKKEFHNMFTRTYGVIYQQNSYVFSDLFNELENYYARGRVDLLEVMDKFFNTLYKKMFQVLNSQYTFDENYLRCVSEHMKDLKPFGEVPDKLSAQIKRSFVATRTYGQALATAAEVSKKVINIRLSVDCTGALTKMQHCGACKGYTEKPCTNYCINVIKGCLHYLNEFDTEWENFVSAMDKVAERLLGSFNIVMVVEPINIKISEAIMNFQESGNDITSRVFQGCGHPKLGRSTRSANPKFNVASSMESQSLYDSINAKGSIDNLLVSSSTNAEQSDADILDIDASLDDAIVLRERRAAEPASSQEQQQQSSSDNGKNNGGKGGGNNRRQQHHRRKQNSKNNKKDNDDNDYGGHDPVLDKIVRDIRQRVKDHKKFWSNLPHQMCSNDEISSSSDVDGMCWNGHTIDRYMHSVTTELGSNPEFPGNPVTTRQTAQISAQLYYLKNAINHLRNAYNGKDVDWSDQESQFAGSGAGSGSGLDDDGDDSDDGSGLGPFTNPDDNINHKTVVTLSPIPKIIADLDNVNNSVDEDPDSDDEKRNNDSDSDSEETEDEQENKTTYENIDYTEPTGSKGGSEKVTLFRALLLYLLPLYMAWFGNICADLL